MEYQNIKTKNIDGNMVEIEGEITAEAMAKYKKRVIENIRKDFEAPGFRKGHAPDEIIEKKTDSQVLLEESASLALNENYLSIVQELDLKVIGTPRVEITKIAAGNPLGFKIMAGLTPKVSLPDYKKIAAKVIKNNPIKEISITKEEVDKVLEEIKKARNIKELNDEEVKKIGQFKNFNDFREKIENNLREEKAVMEKRKVREEIAKEMVREAKLEIPQILVEEELIHSVNQLNEELKKLNLSIEDYLKKMNKTEEEFIKEKREALKNQIKIKFIIEEIARAEKIEPENEEIERQSQLIQLREKEIDPLQAKALAAAILAHEKTFQFLENL